MKEIVFEFEWVPVLSSENGPYSFPEAISAFLKTGSSQPAVYKWSISFEGRLERMYYGEAENLARRIDGYKRGHSGQMTNARIKALFDSALNEGRSIALHKLTFQPFLVNGSLIDERALNSEEVRCFLENALMLSVPPGTELLNKAASVERKNHEATHRIHSSLPPAKRIQLLHKLESTIERKKNATQE